MPKTIPMVITNNEILVKEKETDDFKIYKISGIPDTENIPFYHQWAKNLADCQVKFKEFIKKHYGGKLSKYILAIVTPDDTSPLEEIFINEFFVNSDACKAVAQMTMGQVLSKDYPSYVVISKSSRNVILQYVNNGEALAKKTYDVYNYQTKTVLDDIKKLHIDIEYANVPVFINNFNMNMDDFMQSGIVISPRKFLERIADIDTKKI